MVDVAHLLTALLGGHGGFWGTTQNEARHIQAIIEGVLTLFGADR